MWLELRAKTVDKCIRAPRVDTQFQIVLFPESDRFIGIAYIDRRQWFGAWIEQPKVSEYCYWNNTDPPEGVSYEDFSKRGEVWDRVLGHSPPSMRGFSIEVTDPIGPMPYTGEEPEAAATTQNSWPSP